MSWTSEEEDELYSDVYESDAYTGSEVDYKPVTKGVKRKRSSPAKPSKTSKAVKDPRLPYRATVTEYATDSADRLDATSRIEAADESVIARIKKALALASHAGTGENEAKAAIRMATKLMASQNITQADIMANETEEERSTRAGRSIVTITSTFGKQVLLTQWCNASLWAASTAFDVKCYTESSRYKDKVLVVFYGLADNTVAAALSFEMLHNQILTWAIERKKELKGIVASNNYKYGVAERVLSDAEKEHKAEEAKAEIEEKKRLAIAAKAEAETREAEIARLREPKVKLESSEHSIDVNQDPVDKAQPRVKVEDITDEDEMNVTVKADPEFEDTHSLYDAGLGRLGELERGPQDFYEYAAPDFDDSDDSDYHGCNIEIFINAKQESKDRQRNSPALIDSSLDPVKPEPEPVVVKTEDNAQDASNWSSALQLRTFRENASTIADDFLKKEKVKLRNATKSKPQKYDRDAYRLGWKDGSKVDLKRRRIEG